MGEAGNVFRLWSRSDQVQPAPALFIVNISVSVCPTMMVFLIPLSPPTKLNSPSTMTNSNTLYKVQGLVGLKQDNISSKYKVQGLVGLKLDNISWHELNLVVSRIKESYSILRSFMTCSIFRLRPIFRSEFSFMINFYVSYSLCCLIFPRKYS